MNVVVIDSGVANLASVIAAFKRLGINAEITSDADKIRKASHVVLPGVGAVSSAMMQLKDKGLDIILPTLNQPVLGICLGMQLLFAHSEESDGYDCLGIIPASINRLPIQPNMPIPHMGWNQLRLSGKQHPLLHNIGENSYVYFVHSFAAPLGDYTLASCDYSTQFTAIAGHKNFFGCQFHPERSGETGSQILKNFVEL